jgi:hypothetical protein
MKVSSCAVDGLVLVVGRDDGLADVFPVVAVVSQVDGDGEITATPVALFYGRLRSLDDVLRETDADRWELLRPTPEQLERAKRRLAEPARAPA